MLLALARVVRHCQDDWQMTMPGAGLEGAEDGRSRSLTLLGV